MLSYRHAFHAGNYADVLKHFVQFCILEYLTRKPSGIRYIDTHSGAGMYDLTASKTTKLNEYRQGFYQLLENSSVTNSEPVKRFVELILSCEGNTCSNLKHYPGSPWIAQQLLRAQDGLHLCELHPADFDLLKKNFSTDNRAHLYQENAFDKAKALLPPLEKRAFVLIDPPYEVKKDYENVVELVKALYRKFSVGVFAIWYPVVEGGRAVHMVKRFKNSGIKRIHRFEIARSRNMSASGMYACGMLVINAPWTLAEDVKALNSVFASRISDSGEELTIVEELVGE